MPLSASAIRQAFDALSAELAKTDERGEIIEEHVGDREAVLGQIEAGWRDQRRRSTAAEVDRWFDAGR